MFVVVLHGLYFIWCVLVRVASGAFGSVFEAVQSAVEATHPAMQSLSRYSVLSCGVADVSCFQCFHYDAAAELRDLRYSGCAGQGLAPLLTCWATTP